MAALNISNRAKDFAYRKKYNDFFSQVVSDNPGINTNQSSVKQEIDNQYNALSSKEPTQSSSTNTTTTTTDGGIVGGISSGLKAMGSTSTRYEQGENFGVQAGLNAIFDTTTGKLKTTEEIFKGIRSTIGEGIVLQLKQQSELQEKINTDTAMTGQLSEDFRSSITESYPSAIRLGISFEELATAISDMTSDMGRFRLLNTETMVDVQETGKVYFSNMREAGLAANAFSNVSLGARDSMLAIQEAGKSSLELGLNARTTTTTLVQNIDKLNQYGFKNGINGLNSMVQKAQQLKMDMQSVFTLAEKVMDPEGALSLAANLQAIGGVMGSFNDPIKMMYDATNNVEDLQDSLIGAAESLATYNSEQGRFEVTGANLRKAQAMAKELGISYSELTKLSVQAAQRSSAAADLMAAGLSFNNEEDKEFLTNLAQMKDGKMVIEVPKNLQEKLGATEVALESMSEDQKKNLLAYREEFKTLSTEDIAKKQVSLVENINRDVNFLAAVARIQAGGVGETAVKALGFDPAKIIKESTNLSNKAAAGIEKTGEFLKDGINSVLNVEGRKKAQSQAQPQTSLGDKAAEAEKAKAEAEKAKTQTQPSNNQAPRTVRFEVVSDVKADEISRSIMRNPEMASQFFDKWNDYTSNQ